MNSLLDQIFVNVPFAMLHETYLAKFLREHINPEIGLDAVCLDCYRRSDFVAIANQLRAHGLSSTLHAPFIDLSPGSPDPAICQITRVRFEQVLRLLPIFKPRTVVCHAGYDRRRYYSFKQEWIERSAQVWSWLGSRVNDEGSRLVLENVYEDGPEDLRLLFNQLEGPGVGFCLDTGHQHAFSTTDLEQWVTVLARYLAQVHLHDNSGDWDDHAALGTGTINFSLLFQRLKEIRNTHPVITLEPHREEDLRPTVMALHKLWPWEQG